MAMKMMDMDMDIPTTIDRKNLILNYQKKEKKWNETAAKTT